MAMCTGLIAKLGEIDLQRQQRSSCEVYTGISQIAGEGSGCRHGFLTFLDAIRAQDSQTKNCLQVMMPLGFE